MHWLDVSDFPLQTDPPPLAMGEVHLWLWELPPLAGAASAAAASACLHVLLRRYLTTTAALVLARSPFGKPFLDRAGAPHFNLSHSGSLVAVAVSRTAEIGVDVEQPRRQRALLPLIQRYFAAGETQALAALPAERLAAAFYAVWTCKEAVLKAQGRGIAFGLDRLEFALDPVDGVPLGLSHIDAAAGTADQWTICRFAPVRGAYGALAWRGVPQKVRGFRAAWRADVPS